MNPYQNYSSVDYIKGKRSIKNHDIIKILKIQKRTPDIGMVYTYLSKKQRNKGNANTHPQPIPSHKHFRGGMELRMCSGISLVSLEDMYWNSPCFFASLRSMCRPSLNLVLIFGFF